MLGETMECVRDRIRNLKSFKIHSLVKPQITSVTMRPRRKRACFTDKQ